MDKGAETLTVGWLGLGAMGMAMVTMLFVTECQLISLDRCTDGNI